MWVPLVGRLRRQALAPRARPRGTLSGRRAADVLPHDIEDSGADQGVLDGAGEQERAGILHQGTHDVGAPALIDVMGPL